MFLQLCLKRIKAIRFPRQSFTSEVSFGQTDSPIEIILTHCTTGRNMLIILHVTSLKLNF